MSKKLMSRRLRFGAVGEDGVLGGVAPAGVRAKNAHNAFLACVRADDSWLSFFVVDDYGDLMDSLELGHIVKLPSTIEIIEHADFRLVPSTKPHLKISIEVPHDDIEQGEPRQVSKFGGRAFSDTHARVAPDLKEALASGFEHFLQFGFGGSSHDEPILKGSWPFGDRDVSFFRHTTKRSRWRVFWRQL